MNKILVYTFFFLFFLLSSKSFAIEESKIENKKISDLPVFITSIENINANLIGIIGGKGMKNEIGKSKNFLKRYKDKFVEKGIAFYLFPNVDSVTKASYPRRISEDRIGRLNELVKYISSTNDKPIFIIGFSRGAVDAGFYAKKYPKSISGIILASGIYKNDSNKAKNFSMEKIIGKKIRFLKRIRPNGLRFLNLQVKKRLLPNLQPSPCPNGPTTIFSVGGKVDQKIHFFSILLTVLG